MKIGVYKECNGGAVRFRGYSEKAYPGEFEYLDFDTLLTEESVHLIRENGVEGLIYFNDHRFDASLLEKVFDAGVKYVAVPAVGHDFIDMEIMRKLGIRVSYVPGYSPNAVSEHTVMLTLALLRHFREQICRMEKNDYRIDDLRASELRSMTVGVIGAGRIGSTTIRTLAGFGCAKIYAYDLYPRDEVKAYAEYADLDTVLEKSDVLIFHCVLNEKTRNMINRETIAKMKPGVILVNTARADLFDMEAIIEALDEGKIGALGLDVIDGESILKEDPLPGKCPLPLLENLLGRPDVIYTRHTAFFTDRADEDIIRTTVDGLYNMTHGVRTNTEL